MTLAEEVADIQRQIGQLQFRLQMLVAGYPMQCVGFPSEMTVRNPAPHAAANPMPTGKYWIGAVGIGGIYP